MADIDQMPQTDFIELAADLVSAYVSNNSVPVTDLPVLLTGVHAALKALAAPAPASAGEAVDKPTPAQIKKSVTPDALISFEDGKPYKTLRRHLTIRGLTPEDYRAKYGLPADYPMTAASYSAQRSALALQLGLGQQRRNPAAQDGAETAASDSKTSDGKASDGKKTAPADAAPKKRGRPKMAVAAE